MLGKSFSDVGRTGLIMEGFGIDHVHTKLIPMHGTGNLKEWKPINGVMNKFFHNYEKYLSSYDCERADDNILTQIAELIKKNNIE